MVKNHESSMSLATPWAIVSTKTAKNFLDYLLICYFCGRINRINSSKEYGRKQNVYNDQA
jgi:hypothetical protein